MKKLVVVAILFAGLTQAANAQKGSILLYGNIDAGSNKDNNVSSTNSSFDFNPGVGYQFSNNWTAGLQLAIGSSKYDNGSGTVTKNSNFNVGPFLRYSKSLGDIFSVYGQLNVDYLSSKVQNTVSSITTSVTTSGVMAGIVPAISVNVHKGLALNFNVGGLSYQTTKASSAKSVDKFVFNFGQQVGIGISKNFGGK